MIAETAARDLQQVRSRTSEGDAVAEVHVLLFEMSCRTDATNPSVWARAGGGVCFTPVAAEAMAIETGKWFCVGTYGASRTPDGKGRGTT